MAVYNWLAYNWLAVGQHAGKGGDHQNRQEIGERNQPEPGAGMGQRPSQPADGDPLEPPANQRDAVADDVNTVVAMRKGAGDVVQTARVRSIVVAAHLLSSQRSSHTWGFPAGMVASSSAM